MRPLTTGAQVAVLANVSTWDIAKRGRSVGEPTNTGQVETKRYFEKNIIFVSTNHADET